MWAKNLLRRRKETSQRAPKNPKQERHQHGNSEQPGLKAAQQVTRKKPKSLYSPEQQTRQQRPTGLGSCRKCQEGASQRACNAFTKTRVETARRRQASGLGVVVERSERKQTREFEIPKCQNQSFEAAALHVDGEQGDDQQDARMMRIHEGRRVNSTPKLEQTAAKVTDGSKKRRRTVAKKSVETTEDFVGCAHGTRKLPTSEV